MQHVLQRSARALTTTTAATALLLTGGVVTAHADSVASAPEAGSAYVALGSSFASGPALRPYVDAGCLRSGQNYAHQVAAALSLALTDVTCGGSTTANVLTSPQGTSTGVKPAQLTAVTAATKVVTVTVGGNDVDYLLNTYRYSCQNLNLAPTFRAVLAGSGLSGPTLDFYVNALCGPVDRAATEAKLASVQSSMAVVIAAIKTKAPAARIVVVDYETILPKGDQTCDALPLTGDQVYWLNDVVRQLEIATKQAANAAKVDLVELSKASSKHDACSSDPWVQPYGVGNVLQGAAYHPNAASMTAAAALVESNLTGR